MEKCKPSRCPWVNLKNLRYIQYHDTEWGVPCHDDHKLYEMLILGLFQAGLSWECVLNKRESFCTAYDGFSAETVSQYDEDKIQNLLENKEIIRNQRKIRASVHNSKIFLAIQQEWGSFSAYLWHFTKGQVIRQTNPNQTESQLSQTIAKDLKARGMQGLGSTTVYAYLQAVGVINGHAPTCFLSDRQ